MVGDKSFLIVPKLNFLKYHYILNFVRTQHNLELIPNLSGLTLIFLQVAYWNNDRGAA